MKKFTLGDMQKLFPTDDLCLEYIYQAKYPKGGYYRIDGRKSYADKKGKQIHPLKGTIFEKSSTPLTTWFYALYLFTVSKNGVSAKELQRTLGVTYKCAWRMCHQIRKLMQQGTDPLSGVIEADETYIGGKIRGKGDPARNKATILGAVERGGRVRATVVKRANASTVGVHTFTHVKPGSRLITDEFPGYTWLGRHYKHGVVNHRKKEYARGDLHTNTIEGFWSQLKRSINGTYHYVSPKHLQKYVDEFAFRYDHRDSSVPAFSLLLERAARL